MQTSQWTPVERYRFSLLRQFHVVLKVLDLQVALAVASCEHTAVPGAPLHAAQEVLRGLEVDQGFLAPVVVPEFDGAVHPTAQHGLVEVVLLVLAGGRVLVDAGNRAHVAYVLAQPLHLAASAALGLPLANLYAALD